MNVDRRHPSHNRIVRVVGRRRSRRQRFHVADTTAREAACKATPPPPPVPVPKGCPNGGRSVRPGAVVLGWDWPNATGSPRWSAGYCWQQLSHVTWSSVGLDAAGAVAPGSGGGWDDAAALAVRHFENIRRWRARPGSGG